jgi:pimeloyl-ACP methyl ester carboxylesterase
VGVRPLLAEQRAWLEAAATLSDAIRRGPRSVELTDVPVLLIPGFFAGDAALAPLARWLRQRGCRTYGSQISLNVGCALDLLPELERIAEGVAKRRHRHVTVIGQSRGGSLAKMLAIRRPDVIASIATLGSPSAAPAAIHPFVAGTAGVLRALSRAGVAGLMDDDCWFGECARTAWAELSTPFPENVGYLSLYSRSDGIVDWRACIDPAAENLEVSSSHVGMAVNRHVYRALAAWIERTSDATRGAGPAAGGGA